MAMGAFVSLEEEVTNSWCLGEEEEASSDEDELRDEITELREQLTGAEERLARKEGAYVDMRLTLRGATVSSSASLDDLVDPGLWHQVRSAAELICCSP